MRLVFAGTPDFAASSLQALLDSDHEVVLVLTQPDRPARRGMKTVASPVKLLANKHGVEVYQPQTLSDPDVVARIARYGADAMIVAAYGLILPADVLDKFHFGCINVHASLLPRWRGAAPIQHALLAGDDQTGVCIMQMEEGLDTGPVFLAERVQIASKDTAATLHDKLAALGAHAIVKALSGIEAGALTAVAQSKEGATYASKITRDQARIDWTRSAIEVERSIRAFNPFPGAFSDLNNQVVKIWEAEVKQASSSGPGEIQAVSDHGIVVGCGDSALSLKQLQRPGGKRLPVADFLHGCEVQTGQRFAQD